MKRLTFAAVAFVAGISGLAANASEKEATIQRMEATIQRMAKAEGQIDETTTSSVTARARGAIGEAKAGKGSKGGPYAELIATHAKANGVPVNLARAIVRIESNFRANARGRAGEVGLMQIKPATARAMGYSGSTKGLYHPETNIKYGMKYLGLAHKLGGGTVCGTVLKYNAGHGAKRMNPISQAYCSKLKRHIAS